MKSRILIKGAELFFRYGVKTVTMDDIATDLGISKKTIYQHFPDKDSMVFEVVIVSPVIVGKKKRGFSLVVGIIF